MDQWRCERATWGFNGKHVDFIGLLSIWMGIHGNFQSKFVTTCMWKHTERCSNTHWCANVGVSHLYLVCQPVNHAWCHVKCRDPRLPQLALPKDEDSAVGWPKCQGWAQPPVTGWSKRLASHPEAMPNVLGPPSYVCWFIAPWISWIV